MMPIIKYFWMRKIRNEKLNLNCVCMTVRFRVEQQLEILTQESDTESNASNPLMLVESKKSHSISTGL